MADTEGRLKNSPGSAGERGYLKSMLKRAGRAVFMLFYGPVRNRLVSKIDQTHAQVSCLRAEVARLHRRLDGAFIPADRPAAPPPPSGGPGPNSNEILKIPMKYLLERCQKRKLLIYGAGPLAVGISEFLSAGNMKVEYFLAEGEPGQVAAADMKSYSYIDVVYEKRDGFFIIIASENESYEISRKKFMALGLVEDVDFTYYRDIPAYGEENAPAYYDVTLSYNRIRYGQMEGFEVFGDTGNPNALKIVALGGSTTESRRLFVKGWAPCLADCLAEKGVPNIMYCGGVGGYTSAQELLKLLRDVLPLKPHVVLSYSGWNDLEFYPHKSGIKAFHPVRERRPFITQFQVEFMNEIMQKYPPDKRIVYYGLQNKKTAPELWLDNTRAMQSIAKEFDILFLSFLQPFFYIGGYKPTESQLVIFSRNGGCAAEGVPTPGGHSKEYIEFLVNGACEMRRLVEKLDYVVDFTHIFSGLENIYQDICHVREEGNEIVAQGMSREILRRLNGKGAER